MEIYRSLLAAWQWTEAEQQLAENRKSDQIIKPAYIAALHTIFRQEANFFRSMHTLSFAKKSHWYPLSSIDLKGVIFLKNDLTGAHLCGANLTGTNLYETKFTGADLSGANLKGTTLRRANLEIADLINTNLEMADLTEVSLTDADLTEANLRGAIYDLDIILTAIISQGTQFSSKDIKGRSAKIIFESIPLN